MKMVFLNFQDCRVWKTENKKIPNKHEKTVLCNYFSACDNVAKTFRVHNGKK